MSDANGVDGKGWRSSEFEAAWESISQQISDVPSPSESVRAAAETAILVDGGSSPGLEVGGLPLLSMNDGGEADELVTKKVLGQGGMGKVELAIQRSLRREVAVKSVLGEVDSPNAQALLQEALFTGLLEHPNIVPVHQLGRSSEDYPLLVMKRVEGVSWEALINDPEHSHWKTLGDDRLREHIAILISVCNAVDFAHSRGILHRDIKPANVMVGAFGEVYLLDWGLATKLYPRSESTEVVGTPCQMAPEMLDGAEALSERTDVYLLGASLHTALTGEPRHTGDSMMSVIYSVYASEPVSYPADVPTELADLCNQSTHLDPAQRPPSAAAFRRALERYLEHRSSIQLATETTSGLAVLRDLLQESEPNPERVAGLFAECRFGFGQALRGWPENAVARDGLQECLTLVIERELSRQNLSLSESLLSELPLPAPDLRARVDELKHELSAREAHLEALAHQGDWRRGAGSRAAFFLGLLVFWVALWLWANDGHVRYRGTLTPERLAANVGVALLGFCGTVFALRKQLMTSLVNTRLMCGVLMTGGAIFLHRLANCISAPPTAALVSTEILLCAFAASLGALTLAPWLWLQVPVWLAGAFAARLLPAYAGLCFVISGLIALAVGVWRLRARHTEASPAPAQPPG